MVRKSSLKLYQALLANIENADFDNDGQRLMNGTDGTKSWELLQYDQLRLNMN